MADRILDPIHGNDYDARGGRTSLTDPSGQTTTWDFDGFGDMIAETRPGSPIPYETRTYDNFGRVQTRTMASGEVVEHVYDIGGDPVEERWLNAPTTDTEPLTTRVFDELGRITQTTYANHALAPFGVGDPTVTTTRDYDPLGRVVGESLTALGVTTQTTSSFDAGTGNWIRSATYPSGSQIYEERDQTRRLARSTRISALTADASQSSFAWLGNLPAGRAYSAADLSTTDPFTESAEYDGFGRRTAWQWDALAFAGSSPQNAGFADAYCDGNYDASRCGGPVLQIDAVRDVMGRIASLESRFGHPMTAGSPLPDSAHDTSWHGYTYTRRGYLQRDWNHLGADVVTSSVLANTDTDLAVDALGNSLPTAIALDQLREPDVGSLVSIGESGADPLWQTLAPRDPGHRLTAVEVDQTTYAIAQDDAGRMTEGIDWDFGYDPNNRIASGTNQVNGLSELYLYTANGDLAAVIDVRNNAQIFGYDGDRMVASFDDAGVPLWEATYGDRIDQLIEYHDFAAAGPVVPLLDHRNSPVATWAPNTVAVDQLARYDAHGRLTLLDSTESVVCVEQDTGRVCDAPSGLPFAFNGRWRSPATGLVNMRARWYSPRLGEFTAPDPLGYIDLYDLYGFAAFDPVNGWDPTGLAECTFLWGCRKKRISNSNFVNDDTPVDPDCEDCFDPPVPDDAGEKALRGIAKTVRDDAVQTVCAVFAQGMLCGPLGAVPYEREEITDEHEKVGARWVLSFQVTGIFAGGGTGFIPSMRVNILPWIFKGATRRPKIGSKLWGHAFGTKHHSAKRKLTSLQDEARDAGVQAQWLDDNAAADFIWSQRDFLTKGKNDLPLPAGLGRLIHPDGTVTPAKAVRVIVNSDGSIKTAFPLKN